MADNALIKEETVYHLRLEEVVAKTAALLASVEDGARWAHAIAYGKAGRGLGATRGVVNPESLDERDPDQVPGATYDIGVGDHGTRSAYQLVAHRLGRVERHLDQALFVVTGHRLALAQPTAFTPASELIARRGVIPTCRRRLRAIELHLPRTGITVRRRARPPLLRSWEELNHGDIHLVEQFERGYRPELSPFPLCTICGIRAAAVRWSDKHQRWVATHAGRCNTCAHYYRTHNGAERPRHLDNIDDALEAQLRRLERGEGWGEA